MHHVFNKNNKELLIGYTPVQCIYSGNGKQEEIQAVDRKCKHEVVLHEHCRASNYEHVCCDNVPQCYAREHSLKKYCNRFETVMCFQSKLNGVHLCLVLRHAGNSSCSLGTLVSQPCSVCCFESTCNTSQSNIITASMLHCCCCRHISEGNNNNKITSESAAMINVKFSFHGDVTGPKNRIVV